MSYGKIAAALLTLAALLSLATIAGAQGDPRWLGTTTSGFTADLAQPLVSSIFLTASYSNASYGTGGVALRNRKTGSIQISGVSGATQAAWLYWAVLLKNPTATQLGKVNHLTIARQFPAGAPLPTSAAVYGSLLAIGADPCWGSTGAYVYRASVPTSVATGNGLYKITLPSGASGLTDGEDPWNGNVKFPLFEGASLVVVGTGGSTVGLLDGQAGTTFYYPTTYSNYYQLPATVSTTSTVLLDNIGYDGQIGGSRFIYASNETTNVEGWPSLTNNILVAGPGGETGNSDWDGSSGWPLPQLWDDTGHDITNAFLSGDSWALVSYSAPSDCVGTVGAVISVSP